MQPTKVLIIDDSAEIGFLLKEILESKKVDCDVAASGLDGLALAQRDNPDLILLDIGLPDLDGLEVCRRFKANPELMGIPIIMMTGRESTEDKIRAFEIGASDYINKPFNVLEIQARILATVRQKQFHDKIAAVSRQERQRTQADLLRISKAVDSSSDAIAIVDAQGRGTYLNNAFGELFGLGLEEIQTPGRQAGLFKKPDIWALIWNSCQAGGSWRGEVEMVGPDLRPIPSLCRADSILDDGGQMLGAVFIYTDITQRKRLEQDLIYLANHDPLTSLFNRRHFGELLEHAVEKAKRGMTSFLLYLDLDNFKVVNDSAGHQAGDRLLIDITQLLRAHTRKSDHIARFGGDEFTVLLEEIGYDQALLIAQRFLSLLDEYRFVDQGKNFATGASIGIARIDGSCTAQDVLAQADAACYQVKAKGRNGCEFFKSDNLEIQQLNTEATWSIRIKDALREERMELWLQPILPLKGQTSFYFEVLIRMRDPEGNLVLPGAFMHAAERFGNMQQIDNFIIRHSIRLLQEHPDFRLSINLSAKTLNDPELPALIEGLLLKSQVDPARASFEITETAMIQNLKQAHQLISRIRKLGCRFALDDFGSGASSMVYLRDLPVDYLKIDGSFIQHLDTDPISRALVKSMNEVAHVLGKQTVAEYIVSGEVLQWVRELDIDFAQGWHICQPAPVQYFIEKGFHPHLGPQVALPRLDTSPQRDP